MHHRHVSHLFGLYPGHTITVEKTPNISEAANNTLHKRGFFFPTNFLGFPSILGFIRHSHIGMNLNLSLLYFRLATSTFLIILVCL